MSNPIDEFLEMEKEAGLMDFLRGAGRGLTSISGDAFPRNIRAMSEDAIAAFERGADLGRQMQGGAAWAMGGVAASGLGMAAKKIGDAVAKRREFREMMELDPELVEHQARNPKMFNAAYSSLRNINPAFGRDPLVAGAHMKQFMDNPDTAGLMIARTVRPPDTPRPSGSGFSVGYETGPVKFQRGF